MGQVRHDPHAESLQTRGQFPFPLAVRAPEQILCWRQQLRRVPVAFNVKNSSARFVADDRGYRSLLDHFAVAVQHR